LIPGRKGKSVAKEAVAETERVLGGTKGLLFKIALVESHFGEHRSTYRSGYHGGIFQVDKEGFKATQDVRSHPGLARKFKKINKDFCIDWREVNWRDLRSPLYSAIAARLFLSNKPKAIPYSLEGQAIYWKEFYNTNSGKGSADKFKRRWNQYKYKFHF